MAFPTGAIAQWKLEDTADSVGSYTLTNNGTVTFSTGLFNNAAVFSNSTSQSLTRASIPFGTAGSFSFWAFINTGDTGGYFTDATNGNRYYFYYGGAGEGAISINGSTPLNITSGGIVFNQWNHYVVTWDSAIGSERIKLFINGVKYGTTVNETVAAHTPTTFYIGNRYSNTGVQDSMNGKIEHFTVFNKALSQTEVEYMHRTLTNELKAYWALENTTDSVGSYTLTNTGTTTFTSGKKNNAGTFNGSSQALNNNSVWGATSYPRSYAGWVKFNDVTTSDESIFAIGDGSVHYYTLKLRSSDSKIVFRSNNSTQAADVDTGITASTSTWYHVAAVQHSATSVSLYVDGTKTNTTATTFSATVSQFYLGYLGRSSVWYLDGQIDEVGFWDRTLTDAEVTTLYNSGNGVTYPFNIEYTTVFASGTYTDTGYNYDIGRRTTLTFESGTYVDTGYDFRIRIAGWTNQSKNSSTWANVSKSSSTWANETKNSSTWANQSKS